MPSRLESLPEAGASPARPPAAPPCPCLDFVPPPPLRPDPCPDSGPSRATALARGRRLRVLPADASFSEPETWSLGAWSELPGGRGACPDEPAALLVQPSGADGRGWGGGSLAASAPG